MMNDSENNNTINNNGNNIADEVIDENEPLEMDYGSSSSSSKDDDNSPGNGDTSPKVTAELSERTTNLINNFRNYVDSIDDNSNSTDDDDVELGSDNVATTLLKSKPQSPLASNEEQQQDTPILVKGALNWYNRNNRSGINNNNFSGDIEIDDDDDDYISQEYGISPNNQRYKRRSSFSNDTKYITHKINLGRLGIIKSRRIKRGICSVILLITIATLIGTLSSERKTAINEWNDEINELMNEEELNYEEELNEIKKGVGGSIMSPPDKQFGPGGYQPLPEVDIGSSIQADSGQQPQQAEHEPKQQHGSGAKEQANNIISDVLSHANTMSSTSTTSTSETLMEKGSSSNKSSEGGDNNYIEMANKYHPQWYTRHPSGITSTAYLGTNYNDALLFCAEQSKKLCKYEALCPGGSDNVPAGGYKESSSVNTSGSQQLSDENKEEDTPESIIQWVPIIDQTNSWVQVSSNNNNGCMIYNILHGGYNPSWGLDQDEDGDGKDMDDKDVVNEEETRFVLCCDSVEHDVVEDIPSENEVKEEEPCCWLDGIYYDGEEALQEALQVDDKNQDDNQATHEAWLDSGMDELEAELEAAGVHDENDLLTHTPETKPAHEAIVKPQSDIPDESSEEPTGNQETQVNAVEYAQSIQHEPIWYYRTTGWVGQSYQDAVDFCAADHYPDGTVSDSGEGPHGPEGGVLCPYEVLCPSGPNQHPFGGVIDEMELSNGNEEVSTQWVASSDSPNNWIQVSPGQGMCHTYMSLNLEMPFWGLSGEGNEGITRHVLCCRKMPSLVDDSSVGIIDEPINTQMGAPSKPESAAYLQYETQYQPVWYDRTTGWKGHSYNAAVEFCADLGDNHKLCPYEAYCPLGKNSNPYGGGFDGSLLWAPVSDSYNDWVQIGTESLYDSLTSNVEIEVPCATYMNIHLQNPSWGVDGKGSWEFTGKILCCRSMEGGAEWAVGTAHPTTKHPSSPPTQKPSPEPTSKPSHKPTVSPTEPNAYDKVVAEYNPKWYNREQGWKGQSYYEAVGFCGSLGNDIGEPMMLCPFDAYCPYGEGGIPFGGAGSLSSWAPVKDFDNDWVEIGSTNPCVMYTSIYSDRPSWGETGIGNEAETRNILCCHSKGKASVSQQHTAPNQLADQAIMANELAPIYMQIPNRYQASGFGRKQGWQGNSYLEAQEYCTKKMGTTHEPCGFDVLCPNGIGGEPSSNNNIWVPVLDKYSSNTWMEIREGGWCEKHTSLEENGDSVRYALCCKIEDTSAATPSSPTINSAPAVNDEEVQAIYKDISEKYHPVSFDRSQGWRGQTYGDALVFCAKQNSKIPCPYKVTCPMGDKGLPIGGATDGMNGDWVPIMDTPNGWVNIGEKNTCVKYNDIRPHPPEWGLSGEDNEAITRHIKCCDEPEGVGPILDDEGSSIGAKSTQEKDILHNMHPLWFHRKDGYHGTTHEEAELFCKTIGDMQLCPAEAYCPNGSTKSKPLFLQSNVYQGESWAPVHKENADSGNNWINIGDSLSDGSSAEACLDYESLNGGKSPPWTADGSHSQVKQHVLCCMKENELKHDIDVTRGMNPIWLDKSHGYMGGSYSDAEQYCKGLDKKLCPYTSCKYIIIC